MPSSWIHTPNSFYIYMFWQSHSTQISVLHCYWCQKWTKLSPITSSVLALFGSEAVNKPSSSITTSTLVGSSVLTVAISVEVSALPPGVNNVISLLGVGTAKVNIAEF